MSLLLDSTGSPIINTKGNLTLLDEFESFRQRIWNLFNTQLGSHVFFTSYGFDGITVRQMNGQDPIVVLHSYAIEALNPEQVKGLVSITSMDIEFEGQTGKIDMELLTEYSEYYKTYIEVNI